MYDVIIIGAGVVGCCAARFLSAYDAKILVIDRANDICCGTSKANSAIIHAGFDAKHGSLMAKYNVMGSEMMEELSNELDFHYLRNGSLVICTKDDDETKLLSLYENGVLNGVKGLEIIDRERVLEMEPNISDDVVKALWAPTGAIVCPFDMTAAFAENAARNGVEFSFNTSASGIVMNADGTYSVLCGDKEFVTRTVVNAAGVYSDVFHNMVSEKKIHITPRKGEYMLLDKSAGHHVSSTVFQLPGPKGKGVLVTPTVHGNLLLGPTAMDIDDKDGIDTTADGLDRIRQTAGKGVKDIPLRSVITSFAGVRACGEEHEFVIGEPEDAPGFFDCACIESPGLSSAPAIGKDIAEMIAKKLSLSEDPSFDPERKGILRSASLSFEERAELIRRDPAYGQIICRCEEVSEGEIIDAIRRVPGARDMDGVKRRTRAGMGRCQAGFCTPRVMEILARELGIGMDEVTKTGHGSYIVLSRTGEEM